MANTSLLQPLHFVLASGPVGRVFITTIAESLINHGHRVSVADGENVDLISSEAWRQADVAILHEVRCGADELRAAPKLRALIAPTIGCDWIDLEAASAADVLVVNGRPPENHEGMAEAAILMILAALYDLQGAEAELRGATRRRRMPRMLRGKTLGLIGLGNIGSSVLARLRPWGVQFIVYRPSEKPLPADVRALPLDDVLAQSDILLVVATLNAQTRHLIGADELARMKKDAILVNVSRGQIIDEAALAAHVAAGNLSCIALDVFAQEPLPCDSSLRTLPNAILTPHAIGHTAEGFAAIPRVAVQNALKVAEGSLPSSTLNPEISMRWRDRNVGMADGR
jgi:phosphoglycerate dehydrogenase-like enzyme